MKRKQKRQWVELTVHSVSSLTQLIGTVAAPFEKSVLQKKRDAFVRLENVRWLAGRAGKSAKKIIRYSDYPDSACDTMYIKAATVFRVTPIRKDRVAFWESVPPRPV